MSGHIHLPRRPASSSPACGARWGQPTVVTVEEFLVADIEKCCSNCILEMHRDSMRTDWVVSCSNAREHDATVGGYRSDIIRTMRKTEAIRLFKNNYFCHDTVVARPK